MRKLILITTMVLLSASAQAGISRGLTLASTEATVAAEPSKQADTPKAVEAPKAVETSKPVEPVAGVNPSVDQPKTDQPKISSDKNFEKPKSRRESTEARVIRELHRHGIYW